MAQSKSSKRWLKEHFEDPYVKKAQALGYRSRSTFKLIEIQERDKIILPGYTILDLGAAPGGWSHIASQWVGEKGCVIALDILPMDKLPGVEIIQGDFTDPTLFDQLLMKFKNTPLDLLISDMAPNLSGNKSIDQPRVMHLAELALELSFSLLKPKGGFLVKVFQGEGFDAFLKLARSHFKEVLIRKPKSSRPRSPEMYLLCKGFEIK
jgi:23S rRNA (uridine2552-2'-O)-methyltransferase